MNIVILHGWGHSASMWSGFVSKFHNHKVTVPDLPGFGKEKLISENWGISDYADWVVGKIKEKKMKKVILIGHSFGGKIATEVVLSHPDLVEKLILIASPVLRRPSLPTKAKILLHKIVKKTILTNSLNTSLNPEYRDAKAKKLGKIFVNSVFYDVTNKLKKINVPTLIIWGKDDRDAPLPVGQEMHELIKTSKLKVLNNTGHNIYLENPNLLYGLINKFLNE